MPTPESISTGLMEGDNLKKMGNTASVPPGSLLGGVGDEKEYTFTLNYISLLFFCLSIIQICSFLSHIP